jgi:hypothetical protein
MSYTNSTKTALLFPFEIYLSFLRAAKQTTEENRS